MQRQLLRAAVLPLHQPGVKSLLFGVGVPGAELSTTSLCHCGPFGCFSCSEGVFSQLSGTGRAATLAFTSCPSKATSVVVNDQAEWPGAGRLCKQGAGTSLRSNLQFSGSSTPRWQSRRCRQCSAAWPPSSRSSRTAATSTTMLSS